MDSIIGVYSPWHKMKPCMIISWFSPNTGRYIQIKELLYPLLRAKQDSYTGILYNFFMFIFKCLFTVASYYQDKLSSGMDLSNTACNEQMTSVKVSGLDSRDLNPGWADLHQLLMIELFWFPDLYQWDLGMEVQQNQKLSRIQQAFALPANMESNPANPAQDS